MNHIDIQRKLDFGDFQTPEYLTNQICQKLKTLNIDAETIIEPTCGKGNFLVSAKCNFPFKKLLGFEVNDDYITVLKNRFELQNDDNIRIFKSNFFETDWKSVVQEVNGPVLVLGNLPWVTNSSQGASNGKNLPLKSNFHQLNGIDAITGKSNFDISEYMTIEILSWFKDRSGTVALLLKTAVARKVIAYAQKHKFSLHSAKIFKINSKKAFSVSVDACLLLLQLDPRSPITYDYKIYDDLDSNIFQRIGHRDGLTVANLDDFHKYSYLTGGSSKKWRSGIKHDLSSIMEFILQGDQLVNGLGERINIEPELIYPLMKGSDVAGARFSNGKFIFVTQAFTGEDTSYIRANFPKAWNYLEHHSTKFAARGSVIYKNNPRFSIFGVGSYSFMPWKIAICGLYKKLDFRLIGPLNDKPVMFDDTVYFISFDTEESARLSYEYLQKIEVKSLLNSLIFWDDKRPIKSSILNLLNWDERIIQNGLFPTTEQ